MLTTSKLHRESTDRHLAENLYLIAFPETEKWKTFVAHYPLEATFDDFTRQLTRTLFNRCQNMIDFVEGQQGDLV